MKSQETRTGDAIASLIALVLSGSWRSEPPRITVSEGELATAVSRLTHSDTAALVWWRIRESTLGASEPGNQIRQAYREGALRNALQEVQVESAFAALRASGVEPILYKGWSAARLYANTNLRPLGDVDLLAHQCTVDRANAILSKTTLDIDTWHEEFDRVDLAGWDSLYTHSVLVRLGQTDVRVLGPEHHLHYLCVHFLRHGAWRPIWLCDIAAAVEARPPDFDWDLCLGRDSRKAHWVTCALGLAHALLDARIDDTPVAEQACRLPQWLVPAVLREWKDPSPSAHLPPDLIAASLLRPRAWPAAIRARWVGPIEATVRMNAPLNDLPRLPFQAAVFARRMSGFLARPLRVRLSGAKPAP